MQTKLLNNVAKVNIVSAEFVDPVSHPWPKKNWL